MRTRVRTRVPTRKSLKKMDLEGQELFKEAFSIVQEFLAAAQHRENKVLSAARDHIYRVRVRVLRWLISSGRRSCML